MVIVAQSCEYIKKHFNVKVKQVNYLVYELYMSIKLLTKNNNPTI